MTEVESASTSASSEKDRMEAAADASKILSQGKRNLVCGEVPAAVNQFQEACKILAKAYGETAKECAEAYFYYGQSLLDLARMETGVLGNALQGVPEEEEDTSKSADEQFENGDKLDVEEREKLRIEVYDAMSEKEKAEKSEKEPSNGEKMETNEKGDAKETNEEKDAKETKEEEKDDKETKEEKKDDKETKEEGEKVNGTDEEMKGYNTQRCHLFACLLSLHLYNVFVLFKRTLTGNTFCT
ncbi:nuclear autoantigenic sperm protein [Mytilus galloprovincialis]|uniref:Nuclear autoantigenic sperm protein n=1 Tax=Mytilus galloprovincialis TaxID=29158 RepID=A0A8B6DZP8_MYTGA|nr:nuclear autoantigenic sperm protein [Mytilus galloprovincialis]